MKALKIADVLNNVPGVKAGDASVGIHGSYKVKVFVDGRPINDPTSSHGGVNWDLVSPDDVERIEILRGKGGLTYGQDASGGVILITTRQVRHLTGNIKAYGGNHNTQNVSTAVTTYADGLLAPPRIWVVGVNWRI
jgi:iron complex outermembrane receptor protein